MLKPSHNRPLRNAHDLHSTSRRSGYTLIELLVVIGLIMLMAAITAAAISVNTNADKVRGAARQVQSYLAGARDRAIYSKEPRGVRFLLDPTNKRTVSSMIYVQQSAPWIHGTIQLERLEDPGNPGVALGFNPVTNPNPPALIVRGFDNDAGNHPTASPTEWADLFRRGLLSDGARIKIPNEDAGTWYTISTAPLQQAIAAGIGPAHPPRIQLIVPFVESPNTPGDQLPAFTGKPNTYALELPPSELPNASAVTLPKGTVIHLDRCTSNCAVVIPAWANKLPSAWTVPATSTGNHPQPFDYTTKMDVIFSPRGVVIGSAAQRGIIQLYIADQKDADRDQQHNWSTTPPTIVSAPEYGPDSDGYERSDKIAVTIFTRTGTVSTHPISNISTDPFFFAETGEVAGK